MRTCTISGCEQPYFARGYCRRCYKRIKPEPIPRRKTCKIPDCGAKHSSRGYCKYHYNKLCLPPDYSTKCGRRFRKNHPNYDNDRKTAIKRKALEMLGGRCACCGVSEWWNLTVDHVRPVLGKRKYIGIQMFRSVVRGEADAGNLQVLCFGCNASKNRYERCKIDHEAAEK